MEGSTSDSRHHQQRKENMEITGKRIVVWCGAAANQKALVNKIAEKYTIAGIVIDLYPGGEKKRKLTELAALIWDRVRYKKIYYSWKNLMVYYNKRFKSWPDVPLLKVEGINKTEVVDFTEKLRADLIIVSGTALIKEPLLNVKAKTGIINLHTGLSPHVKGAPNCTNWCIANNTWNLIGNTIMWLNAGIDAGSIITTETIDIRNAKDLNDAHIAVMEHAHELYLRSIRYLINNNPPYQSVSQKNLGEGKLYLNRMWTAEKRKQMLHNWKNRKQATFQLAVVTVPLPEVC